MSVLAVQQLRALGLVNVGEEASVSIWRGSSAVTNLLKLTCQELRDPIIGSGLISQSEFDRIGGDLPSIRELADRIEGKPAQAVTVGGEGGGAIPYMNVSPAENEQRLQLLLAKVGLKN